MKTAWIFSGQGAQSAGMGRDLYNGSASARTVYDRADEVLGFSIADVCFNGPEDKLISCTYCQSAIYTTSLACLAAFLERFTSAPAPVAAAGLSLGEYSALSSAGYFSFEDGLRLVTARGALMEKACQENPGGMASILGGDPEIIEQVCRDLDIDVANYNCPGQIVISGPPDRVSEAAERIKAQGAKRAVVLKVAGAFHSRLMAPAGEALKEVLAAVPVGVLKFPVAQNFTGKFVKNESDIKADLASQVAGSVRWDSCVREIIAKTGADTFIEFGPGSVLTGLVRRIAPEVKLMNVSSLADLEKISF